MLGGLPEAILSLDRRRRRHQQHSIPTDADTDHSAASKSHWKRKDDSERGDESDRRKLKTTAIGVYDWQTVVDDSDIRQQQQ
jgi:hypothetical protein